MKKIFLFISIIFIGIMGFTQNVPPIAVNDTIFEPVNFGDTIVVHVLLNDYDPDGDAINILSAGSGGLWGLYFDHTDSTISFAFDPIVNVSYSGSFDFGYIIEDELGNVAEESTAIIHFTLENKSSGLLDINNISARFNAYGNHFWDMDAINHYRYPKDSTTNTLFNFAFWLGGMDDGNALRFAGERYRGSGADFATGPLSFNEDSAWAENQTIAEYLKVWKLNKTQVEYHLLNWSNPNYVAIDEIMSWPAHGDEDLDQSPYLAPFVDVDENQIYEPMNGDYPLIRGDQSLFFIFNDGITHNESAGEQIGIEIHGFAYAFDSHDDPYLNNTTFLSYKLFNRSPYTLHDTYAGLFTDIDLGYAWDDYVGCMVERGAYYIYNGDSIDGDGDPFSFGDKPPAQGVVVLGGPYMDADGEDNPYGGCDESINGVGFGDGVADNERFGMNRFIYFNNGAPAYAQDPSFADEYYNFMKGIWKDGEAMIYGGNGHPSAGGYGPEARFMFPGLTDPCDWGTGGNPPNGPADWTEVTAGNDPMDRRGLCSMGPFTLEAGGFHKIDIAFVTALGEDYLQSIEVLKTAIDSVKSYYFADPDHFGFAWLGEKENTLPSNVLLLYPNPVDHIINFEYNPTSTKARFELYNSMGRRVQTGNITGSGILSINITSQPSGIYILKVKDEDLIHTAKFLKR